jgi:hypothetical protein
VETWSNSRVPCLLIDLRRDGGVALHRQIETAIRDPIQAGQPGPEGRLLSRRDIPLRDKTLYRMLYETAARAAEITGILAPPRRSH